MSKEIIINSTVNETRVAILENGTVSEIYIERHNKKGVAGNIYKGKVVKVLPGMQSAFVDIGLEKAAFLHVADLIAENINEDMIYQNIDEDQTENDIEESVNGKQQIPIEDIIQEGQEIVVQVAKEPIGQKGARLTTHLTLPGRYLVLMPYYNHIGVSRKIEDEEERERLRNILAELKPNNFGLIARTVSEGSSKEDLESDMDYLLRLWNKISEKMSTSNAPELLYKDLELLFRTLRDITTNDVKRIIIDNRSDYLKLKSFYREYLPNLDLEIKLYENSIPIFDYYNIEIEINRMFDRVVWLKSGGYIVIDQAEALTVIDVNTGRFVGKRNFEETILKTNLEAAKEIAYQLRLRNIGGIIIVDFIDMEREEHIEKVLQTLNQEFKKDRGKVTVVNISPLGLFEITRKRVKESLTKALSENCPYCDGKGFIKSKVTVCYDILREIRRIAPYYEKKKIFIEAHSDVVDILLNNEKDSIDEIELMFNVAIEVKANNTFHIEHYEVIPLESI
ncbi:Rne/Rng family ribonuclease [Deferribacter autotrophicus]|uniref:Ribonuclease G n=1 Tax=Deferribacter autotrophicus TaxID=500465 RepID=A0A5A8F6R3_9BACT|nr:Rne/Rng family ribonuclease [Deferribacter autotrophicus]KAA0258949.1 Rne/Rng family ribonuclease [Deferribacter autotrophicus]